MTQLYFEKISKYDRDEEPVAVAIPFAQGSLTDPAGLAVLDGDRELFCQKRILSRWEEESIKWLFVQFLADLTGNAGKTLSFAIRDPQRPQPASPPNPVSVEENAAGATVNTGRLEFLIAREDFDLVRQVKLDGQPIWGERPFSGFRIVDESGDCYIAGRGEKVELEIVESGPIRAVVEISGKHYDQGGRSLFDYRCRIYAYAGKPWIEVEYQFINREKPKSVTIKEIALDFQTEPLGQPRLTIGRGHYQTDVRQGSEPQEMEIKAETIIYDAHEHMAECFYGDFLADYTDEKSGLAISIYQAFQNFPKKLACHQEGISVYLFPPTAQPREIYQGVAKTHKLLLNFHPPEIEMDEILARSLQFQLPDRPTVPEEWHAQSGVWENVFPETKCQRLDAEIANLLDRGSRGLGMLHFGDAPDPGYTYQGRGRGATIWVNNECDISHAMYIQYARTGDRRCLGLADATARHWMDVDFCHYHPDPLINGGLIAHSRDHVAHPSVNPSHEWTEGLIDHYHFTGDRQALETAISIGENMMRHLATPADLSLSRLSEHSAPREPGWAMRGLLALYLETHDNKYLEACRQMAESFLEWQKGYGTFLCAYTSHSLVRVPFMIAIAVNALGRYYWVTGDERIKKCVVEVVDDLIEHCLRPDGIFYYKELPSLKRPAASSLLLESLTFAYEFTGKTSYLEVARRQLSYLQDTDFLGSRSYYVAKKEIDGDAVVKAADRVSANRILGPSLVPLLRFLAAAGKEGILDSLDW